MKGKEVNGILLGQLLNLRLIVGIEGSLSLLSVLILLSCYGSEAQRIDDICTLFSNGTIIADPESCTRYITCIDFKSVYTSCSGAKPFFDKDTQACVKSLANSDECGLSCANAVGTWISDPKSCYGFYYCANEQTFQYGTCADGQHFNETQQRCVYKSTSECKAHELDYCSIIKNGINFDSHLGCNRYYVCTKGELIDSTCKTGYYDASQGLCVAKTLVKCDAHPLPKEVCGTEKKVKKNTFVSDGATCHGYFYCGDNNGKPDENPIWGRCADDLFFDSSSQECVHPSLVTCSEDRCQGRTLPFVLSPTKGCRHYLRCKDGRTMDEKTCNNYFFSEETATCISSILSYPICK